MRPKFLISDISLSEITSKKYDYAFFFSGYEERCAHLSSLLNFDKIKETISIRKTEKNSSSEYLDSDSFTNKAIKLNFSDFKNMDFAIKIAKILQKKQNKISILVDYSSMPRQVYCDIINVAKTLENSVEIDFFYAHGTHEHYYKPAIVGDMYCLRGCESFISTLDRTIAIVGLGFDDGAALRILESVEPNEVYCLYAHPAAIDGYETMAIEKNKSIIRFSATRAQNIIPAPISSVSDTYSTLYELTSPYLSNSNITILPFGPKPHVLASILISMTHARVSCMYATTTQPPSKSVPATGEVTCTRVSLA
ncbi:hypothetical protein [Alcanivorax sp. NBRC 102028]|uniref:hypothetical protein n=1 Tax=Alcanivorax sp. NBRC 102028 TaxID=1113897 RepID=UPI000A416255|nr:hypothetical protein [Alcanivorax sp. NBRC 102028]